MNASRLYDIFIIGGGINGCGIARDAAGRGFHVGLAEMNDLGSGTSSWSTKLIHGGLRYLEHREFRLVREALIEREVLWRLAPHVVRPLRFVLPHHSGLRPAWLLRLGLFLYDHLGGRRDLPATRSVDLSGPLGAPLRPEFTRGFEYSDARVDDTRLVVLNARDASARDADILVRTRVVSCRPTPEGWAIELDNMEDGARHRVRARFLVNAAGPWVDGLIRARGNGQAHNVRLVQGSHIVTRKLYEHDRAYIFQNGDGRIVFTIPYEDDFTLIGTTDRDFDGDPASAAISEEETDYLIAAVGDYLKTPIAREDIVWSFAGVRPLFDDHASKAQEATRDYVLKLGQESGVGVLDVFGGKITTYRRLAEEAMEQIEEVLERGSEPWTGEAPLPGGDFTPEEAEGLAARLQDIAPELSPTAAARLVRAYGTDAASIVSSPGGLGHHFGADLFEAEVNWLMREEWARSADDVLWRRSKLGLRFSREEAEALDSWMSERLGMEPPVEAAPRLASKIRVPGRRVAGRGAASPAA
ncbi:glycerol-3-phosphate dehydrogenase [Aureimonas mangrovi]|uniref:glycerol-3-phosphate dehydrogenase n=1 Tax=Aureimonas mangrovi TaxID=2758041 RepID=UPI00163DDAC0|nr:glycerol-3-phosphate dehydrogenase [Aureimonas mangrovi]